MSFKNAARKPRREVENTLPSRGLGLNKNKCYDSQSSAKLFGYKNHYFISSKSVNFDMR